MRARGRKGLEMGDKKRGREKKTYEFQEVRELTL